MSKQWTISHFFIFFHVTFFMTTLAALPGSTLSSHRYQKNRTGENTRPPSSVYLNQTLSSDEITNVFEPWPNHDAVNTYKYSQGVKMKRISNTAFDNLTWPHIFSWTQLLFLSNNSVQWRTYTLFYYTYRNRWWLMNKLGLNHLINPFGEVLAGKSIYWTIKKRVAGEMQYLISIVGTDFRAGGGDLGFMCLRSRHNRCRPSEREGPT